VGEHEKRRGVDGGTLFVRGNQLKNQSSRGKRGIKLLGYMGEGEQASGV